MLLGEFWWWSSHWVTLTHKTDKITGWTYIHRQNSFIGVQRSLVWSEFVQVFPVKVTRYNFQSTDSHYTNHCSVNLHSQFIVFQQLVALRGKISTWELLLNEKQITSYSLMFHIFFPKIPLYIAESTVLTEYPLSGYLPISYCCCSLLLFILTLFLNCYILNCYKTNSIQIKYFICRVFACINVCATCMSASWVG